MFTQLGFVRIFYLRENSPYLNFTPFKYDDALFVFTRKHTPFELQTAQKAYFCNFFLRETNTQFKLNAVFRVGTSH